MDKKTMPDKYRDLVDIIGLMVSSDHLYKDASIEELKDSIIPAMELEQYDILRDENGKAVSFAIWAFLNKQAHLRFRRSACCLDSQRFSLTSRVQTAFFSFGNERTSLRQVVGSPHLLLVQTDCATCFQSSIPLEWTTARANVRQ